MSFTWPKNVKQKTSCECRLHMSCERRFFASHMPSHLDCFASHIEFTHFTHGKKRHSHGMSCWLPVSIDTCNDFHEPKCLFLHAWRFFTKKTFTCRCRFIHVRMSFYDMSYRKPFSAVACWDLHEPICVCFRTYCVRVVNTHVTTCGQMSPPSLCYNFWSAFCCFG